MLFALCARSATCVLQHLRISKRILCFSCDSPIFNVCSSALLSHRSAEEHTLKILRLCRRNLRLFASHCNTHICVFASHCMTHTVCKECWRTHVKNWRITGKTKNSFWNSEVLKNTRCTPFTQCKQHLRLFASHSLVCVYLRLCDAICVYLRLILCV